MLLFPNVSAKMIRTFFISTQEQSVYFTKYKPCTKYILFTAPKTQVVAFASIQTCLQSYTNMWEDRFEARLFVYFNFIQFYKWGAFHVRAVTALQNLWTCAKVYCLDGISFESNRVHRLLYFFKRYILFIIFLNYIHFFTRILSTTTTESTLHDISVNFG